MVTYSDEGYRNIYTGQEREQSRPVRRHIYSKLDLEGYSASLIRIKSVFLPLPEVY